MSDGGFMLLEPGPLGRDELRGDVDLIEAHNLTNITSHVISGRLQQLDYVRGVACMGEFRKGPGLELGPVAELHPASVRPNIQPLSSDVLLRGFVLQPGRYSLSEADKGTPVASALSQAGAGSTATAPNVETTKEKRRKEKKEKKRRREEPKDAAAPSAGPS